MRPAVLALDYDGTIARNDVVDPAVRAAIAGARTRGLLVLIVTGRRLDDLHRVAGGLHFVDGVVAENGAIVHFPDSGHTSVLAPPVPAPFAGELGRRGIPFAAGQCVVEADAGDGGRLLEVIRTLELPLVLVFNRSRVMVLPQGVSKATGLAAALGILRASARNAVAVGDAENDHELLRLAEVGAAVAWGSAALQRVADLVVPGRGPADLAPFLQQLARGDLETPRPGRRRILLGYEEDGQPFSLAIRGRNALIAGDARSGKSWIAGLFCEQLILQGYSVCVIDPEGDYRSLEALPGVSVIGGDDPPPTPRELVRALRYPDRSLVIDLSHQPYNAKIPYVRALLGALMAIRRRTGLPHRVLVDEAHYFLHEPDASELLDLQLNGYIVVSYRASQLPKTLLAASEVVIVTSESSAAEVGALHALCSACEPPDFAVWKRRLAQLGPRQAVALPVTEETGRSLRLFTMAERLTPHVRHREKYADVPVPDRQAFAFASNGHGPGEHACTLREFVAGLESLDGGAVKGHLARGDFSRWVRDVFGDRSLAIQIEELERRYGASAAADAVPDLVHAIRERYDLSDESQ
jgi:hypothetical protein